MRRLSKFLFRTLFFVAIGFVAYAIFADLPAPVGESVVTLPLPGAVE